VDEEEALAAAETIATGSKLHYATEHCHYHICQKKGESSPSSGDRKCTPRRTPKARGGAEGEARGGAGGAVQRDTVGGACGGSECAVGGEHRPPRDDTCHNCDRAGHWARDCRQPR
jgi:hypothetical protein